MDTFLLVFSAIAVIFGALYAVAKFVKICIEIYNSWPRRPRPPWGL